MNNKWHFLANEGTLIFKILYLLAKNVECVLVHIKWVTGKCWKSQFVPKPLTGSEYGNAWGMR